MVSPARSRLRLHVSPGGRETRVLGRHGDGWKVRVAAAPERGRANDELLRHLAERLDLPCDRLEIVSGAGSRLKTVALVSLALDEAERRLAAETR
jgi:uncharacterized protein